MRAIDSRAKAEGCDGESACEGGGGAALQRAVVFLMLGRPCGMWGGGAKNESLLPAGVFVTFGRPCRGGTGVVGGRSYEY